MIKLHLIDWSAQVLLSAAVTSRTQQESGLPQKNVPAEQGKEKLKIESHLKYPKATHIMNCLYHLVAVTDTIFLKFEALLLFAPKSFQSFIPLVLI